MYETPIQFESLKMGHTRTLFDCIFKLTKNRTRKAHSYLWTTLQGRLYNSSLSLKNMKWFYKHDRVTMTHYYFRDVTASLLVNILSVLLDD